LTFLSDLDNLEEEEVNTKSSLQGGIDIINSKDEELVDYFDFETTVTNWNDFCQVSFKIRKYLAYSNLFNLFNYLAKVQRQIYN